MSLKNTFAVVVMGTALFSANSDFPKSQGPGDRPRFIIAVVGEGLDNDCRSPLPDDACAMYRGAEAAFEDRFNQWSQYFELRKYDDSGSAAEAAKRATELRGDPRVLAVIGHSASETTRTAVPIYSQAQIPVLVPIATSSRVAYPEEAVGWSRFLPEDEHSDPSRRQPNVFQIIPNDRIGQAPALAYTAGLLTAKPDDSVVVVADLSDNTEYVRGLDHELLKLLAARHITISEDLTAKDLPPHLLDPVLTTNSKPISAVIFIGTAKAAERFLPFLIKNNIPTLNYIVLTDGAMDIHVSSDSVKNLPILLTFPVKQIAPKAIGIKYPHLSSTIKENDQSYEVYGYDAMLMLAEALERRDKKCAAANTTANCEISRPRMVEMLRDISMLRGVATAYLFSNGENVHPEYGLYGSVSIRDGSKRLRDCKELAQLLDPAKPYVTDKKEMRLSYYCAIGFDAVNAEAPE